MQFSVQLCSIWQIKVQLINQLQRSRLLLGSEASLHAETQVCTTLKASCMVKGMSVRGH